MEKTFPNMIMFIMYKMGEAKQINIKNQTYYYLNEIINIKKVDARLLKFDKKTIQRGWPLQHWIYHKEKN